MGIAVHYKGRINNPVNIDSLIDEISDICSDMKWEYTIIEKEENDIDHPPIQGIVFSIHEGCEPVGFIFDKKGLLRSPISIPFYEENDDNQLVVSVKTQSSSPDIHIVLIKLLRYIKSKYIENLEVTDEGEFWETSNKERLKYLFDFLNEKLNIICDILATKARRYKALINYNLKQIIIVLFRKTQSKRRIDFIFNILGDLVPSWQNFINNPG